MSNFVVLNQDFKSKYLDSLIRSCIVPHEHFCVHPTDMFYVKICRLKQVLPSIPYGLITNICISVGLDQYVVELPPCAYGYLNH